VAIQHAVAQRVRVYVDRTDGHRHRRTRRVHGDWASAGNRVRLAVGARVYDVVSLIGFEATRLIVAGVVLGVLSSLLASRLLASLLFRVEATDRPDVATRRSYRVRLWRTRLVPASAASWPDWIPLVCSASHNRDLRRCAVSAAVLAPALRRVVPCRPTRVMHAGSDRL
jgi:hypothetical protein